MAKGGGQTIIVAGGGGAGGSKGGGGSSKGGKSGGSSSGKSKGGLGGKFKLDDQTFWTIAAGLGGVAVVAYVYTSRPDLVNEFIGTLAGTNQPQVPAQPPGTVQNDVMPQQTQAPGQSVTVGAVGGGVQQQLNYPYPQQSTGQQPFQFPQQPPSMNLQQYQPYQPTNYGGDNFTSYNPAFNQNSNSPTYSFTARRKTKLEFDSEDGTLRKV